MIDREDADDFSADLERNGDFRACVDLAGYVVGVEGYVGGITQLSSGGDVANHTLMADAEAFAFLVDGAAANSVKDHVVTLGVAEPDGDFDAADGVGDVVDDAIEEAIEIERGGDELR